MAKDTQYQRLKPAPGLRDIVESIWVQHLDQPFADRAPSWVVPTGTVEILFQYGEPVAHLHPQGRLTMPKSYVTGQRSRPVQVIGTGTLGIVIVSLYPWGLSNLYPGAVTETDSYLDLNLLDNSGQIARLEDALARSTKSESKVRLIESFLMKLRQDHIDRRMAAASRLLANSQFERPLRRAARTLEISERHLSRTFKSTIGLPPSVFVRIMRFQRAIRMRRMSNLPWAAIAASCGFSDQAHLIHEVREFTGRSPGQIVLDAHSGDSTFNGEGVSRFFDTVYM